MSFYSWFVWIRTQMRCTHWVHFIGFSLVSFKVVSPLFPDFLLSPFHSFFPLPAINLLNKVSYLSWRFIILDLADWTSQCHKASKLLIDLRLDEILIISKKTSEEVFVILINLSQERPPGGSVRHNIFFLGESPHRNWPCPYFTLSSLCFPGARQPWQPLHKQNGERQAHLVHSPSSWGLLSACKEDGRQDLISLICLPCHRPSSALLPISPKVEGICSFVWVGDWKFSIFVKISHKT